MYLFFFFLFDHIFDQTRMIYNSYDLQLSDFSLVKCFYYSIVKQCFLGGFFKHYSVFCRKTISFVRVHLNMNIITKWNADKYVI